MTPNNFEQIIKEYSKLFNQEIEKYFNFPHGDEKRVTEAMHYSLSCGGKRLRPFLVYTTAKLFGVEFADSLPVAMALEMLHTYSLIHDDLPAMDNDDFRRGVPTCHKKFDEATAILAGDGLLTYAFEILSSPQTSFDTQIRCKLISLLAKAAGAFDGMIAGQMLDLSAAQYTAQTPNAEEIINHIEEMKTGRLLRYAVEAGATLGNAPFDMKNKLLSYARKIGIAFQITDDILDVTGDAEVVGKTLHKDNAQNKLTFINLYGLEKSQQTADRLINEAINELSVFGDKAKSLILLAQYIITRNH
jgi:farnesyl diphosphate synthase